jgi:hypothetical protein
MSTRRRVVLSVTALLFLVAAMTVPAAGQGGRGGGAGVEGGRGGGGRGAGVPPAGPVPRRADGKPDLTGRWDGSGGVLHNTVILEEYPGGFGIQAGGTLIIDPKDGTIPYQPWALAERDRRREDANGYEDQVGHCEIYEVGRLASFAFDIAHASNGDVIIHHTQHITRVIDMNRRQHLPDGIRLWNGDPIGRWEGDTLVIDTTNLNAKGRMALGGDFYSADARLVERFTMKDSNTIDWTLTITDPKVFTRPWTMKSATPMMRRPPANNFDGEDTCHEGNVDLVHLKNVYDQTHGKVPWPPVYPEGPQGRWGGTR